MSYPVENIITVNVNQTPGGITFANFASIFFFGVQADLESGVTFDDDTYKDYASLDEVGEDFTSDSPVYLAASRWFAQTPRPETFSVYMWNDDPTTGDTPAEAAAKANDKAWRYFYRFPNSILDTEADVTALATWADANNHYTGIITTSADAIDPLVDTDIGSVLQAAGNRHISVGYREPSTVSADASQGYADVQLFAAFQKFRPDGLRTAITGEYQVLPGVVGESLSTTAYTALKDKSIIFWTEVELQGATDASRTINSRSMSSFNEFMDDVINIDVLSNRLKVNGYNFIASGKPSTGGLTPEGYAGLLSTLSDTFKVFYDNGALGRAQYTDPVSGEQREAKYGYVIFSEPQDVFNLSAAQRRDRQYPDVSALAILSRAGHSVNLNLTVE